MREVVVATTITVAELVTRRVCLDQEGLHVLEAEAAAQNMASGFLVLDDGSAESANVASVMRFANHPQRVRSETVALHAGEPCYLVSVDTGIDGVRATTRLIRLDPDSRIDKVESTRENGKRQNLIDTLWVYEDIGGGWALRAEIFGDDLLVVGRAEFSREWLDLPCSTQREFLHGLFLAWKKRNPDAQRVTLRNPGGRDIGGYSLPSGFHCDG